MKKVTAVEFLKTFGASNLPMITDLAGTLRRFMDDKQFNPHFAIKMARSQVFGHMFSELVLGDSTGSQTKVFDYMGSLIPHAKPALTAELLGSGNQNAAIDRALTNSGHRNTANRVQGEGATSFFSRSGWIWRIWHPR